MGPKNSNTSSHEPVKDCLRIPQQLEEDAVENDEGLEEVEWLTGEDEEDNDDGDDDDDRDGEDDRENGDEEDNDGEYDEEDYEYDRWHEFVRNDCEWSSQELDWGSNNSQGSNSVKSNEIPNCQGDTRRKDNIDSTGRNEKIESRVTKAKIDSTGRNQNKDKGRLICYNGDDDFVDPPSVRVRSDYGSSSGLKRRLIAYGGDDDFVDHPRVRRDNGGSALKKGMHVTEIYGYADLEPMFRDTETNKYKIHEVDLSGEDDDIYIGRVFNDKEEFKLVMAIYAIKRVFRFVFSRHTCNSVVASCITKMFMFWRGDF